MNKKRLLAFFITMVMIISIIPLGTIGTAAYEIDSLDSSVEFCPLEIQVKTDKASYSSMSTAYYYITIKNISEKKIEKIKWTNPTLGDVNKPSRTNYRFDGWYTAASGGTQYTHVKEITGNITLYAHWTPIPFDVPNYAGWDLGDATNNLQSFMRLMMMRLLFSPQTAT